jgi:hypothetical protein
MNGVRMFEMRCRETWFLAASARDVFLERVSKSAYDWCKGANFMKGNF